MGFTKVVRIGTARTYGGRAYSVYCKIKYSDGRLSITGVEGPTNGGNCLGGCGQINLLEAGIVNFAPGWDQGKLETLAQTWDAWHLNDMRAGCEHQRADWNTKHKITLSHYTWSREYHALRQRAEGGKLSPEEYERYKEATGIVALVTLGFDSLKWDRHPAVLYALSRNLIRLERTEEKGAGWVRSSEHPEGLLTKPCPVCGYKYGTAWLREDVPAAVLDWLRALPDTDQTPAWV